MRNFQWLRNDTHQEQTNSGILTMSIDYQTDILTPSYLRQLQSN